MVSCSQGKEQGEEVAATVTKASGVPAVWQPWQGEVAVPAGTTLLMNATHLGCAPDLEPVPVRWDTVERGCVAVDVITNPRITPFLATAREPGAPQPLRPDPLSGAKECNKNISIH